MAKFKLVSSTKWIGSEQSKKIDGEFENEDEVIESLGGIGGVEELANQQQGLCWVIEKID